MLGVGFKTHLVAFLAKNVEKRWEFVRKVLNKIQRIS
jgi:hypothetical protein